MECVKGAWCSSVSPVGIGMCVKMNLLLSTTETLKKYHTWGQSRVNKSRGVIITNISRGGGWVVFCRLLLCFENRINKDKNSHPDKNDSPEWRSKA